MSLSIVHLYGWNDGGEDDLAVLHYMRSPLDLLGSRGVSGQTYPVSHPLALRAGAAADITVLHLVSGLQMEALILHRRRNGLPTLYQVGDDPAAYRAWARTPRRSVSQLQGIYHAATLCDGVQFTSAGLQQKFHSLHTRHTVLPLLNAIPSSLPAKPWRFTVGWGGSSSHSEDLEAIAPVLVDFCKRHPEVQVAVIGNESMLRDVFRAVPEGQLLVKPYAPYPEYASFFRTFHVGLAPIRNTAINQGRTDSKLVEYGIAGAAVIAQRSGTFAALQSFTLPFTTNQELAAHLERCYGDREFCRQQARQMLQHLQATRSNTVLAQQHLQWYERLAPLQRSRRSLPEPDPASDEALRSFLSMNGDQAQQEQEMSALLSRVPQFDTCRMRLAHLLASQRRYNEAAFHARVLLRSPFWHDEALLLLTANGTLPRDRITRSLHSPLLRAERATRMPDSLAKYFQDIQCVAPMHYFMLGYMRHKAASADQREQAQARLALYDTRQ